MATNEESPKKKIKTQDTEDVKPEENGSAQKDFLSKIREQRENFAASVSEFQFNKQRVQMLSEAQEFPEDSAGGVVYWMSRDQRVQDNWALLYAQRLALKLSLPLHVCFCLVPGYHERTLRQFSFMCKGLQEVETECNQLDISFHLLTGEAKDKLPEFVKSHDIGGVVADFSPLREPRAWLEDVKKALPEDVTLCQVDAHNVVPVAVASEKLEYAARTIRTKIHKVLDDFFTEFPPVIRHPHPAKSKPEPVDWESADSGLAVDKTVSEVDWAISGSAAGLRNLETFIKERLRHYQNDRNNPNKEALSDMSPWFHFGQVSVQRATLMVQEHRSKYRESVEGYIEEGIVRRELAENFCFYNEHYDSVQGAHDWAKTTLKEHAEDERSWVYTREQLEQSKTHDDLWNAAQRQLTREGKMHGFLRMYWAKKILEWTESPEQAISDAIYLNDKYSLDGCDPNGYVGCMWSICGVHDQGWKERPIFGKIRYMNYDGCKKKFDVAAFVKKYAK